MARRDVDWGMTRTLQEIQKKIAPVLRKYGVVRASVFGSHARGEESVESDLDLLVEFEPGRSLLDLAGLREDLCTLLGRKVDVVTPEAIHPLIRDPVLRERVPIL